MPWALPFAAVAGFNVVCAFNDGGNLLASLLAARAFSLAGAALVLLAGAAAGPWLVGTRVAHTVVFAVVALPRLGPGVLLAAVAAAVLTLLFCWWRALPTSTSLALVGALAGAGLVRAGPAGVRWGGVGAVLAAMVVAAATGAAGGWLAWRAVHTLLRRAGEHVGGALRGLQAATGILQGVGYGANGAAKAIGLFALVAAWQHASGRAALAAGLLPVPAWCVWAAVATFGVGLAAGGARVARTLGFGLYRVRAADALAAQMAAGVAVVALALAGGPVSSSQTATAALLAAGAARRLSRPRWSLVAQMGRAWAVTLPLALGLGGALAALLGTGLFHAGGCVGACRLV